MSGVIDPASVRTGDVRLAIAQMLEEARATAWGALRESGEGASIPIGQFARFVEGLAEIDRALVALDRRAGIAMRAAG